jgi:hypothetical protein
VDSDRVVKLHQLGCIGILDFIQNIRNFNLRLPGSK